MTLARSAVARLARGARRMPWVLATAALLAATTVVVALWGNRPATGDPTRTDWARVGVDPGGSVDGYLAAARAELASLDGPARYALVGFSPAAAPAAMPALLDGASVAVVLTRVPLAGGQPELIRQSATRLPDDVVAGMAASASRKEAEAARYAELLAATADPDRRSAYEIAERTAAAEAQAYRSGCSCAYAAVIRASPGSLRAVAARRGVWFVDPAPEVRRVDRAVFLPPLPGPGASAGSR